MPNPTVKLTPALIAAFSRLERIVDFAPLAMWRKNHQLYGRSKLRKTCNCEEEKIPFRLFPTIIPVIRINSAKNIYQTLPFYYRAWFVGDCYLSYFEVFEIPFYNKINIHEGTLPELENYHDNSCTLFPAIWQKKDDYTTLTTKDLWEIRKNIFKEFNSLLKGNYVGYISIPMIQDKYTDNFNVNYMNICNQSFENPELDFFRKRLVPGYYKNSCEILQLNTYAKSTN